MLVCLWVTDETSVLINGDKSGDDLAMTGDVTSSNRLLTFVHGLKNVNSCAPGSCRNDFCKCNFRTQFTIWFLHYFLYNRSHVSATDLHFWMMTSSNGNIFRVIGPLCGEFTVHRWLGALMFTLIFAWKNDSVTDRNAGDLRPHRAHYDVIVLKSQYSFSYWFGTARQQAIIRADVESYLRRHLASP